jgi:hypothetical protein
LPLIAKRVALRDLVAVLQADAALVRPVSGNGILQGLPAKLFVENIRHSGHGSEVLKLRARPLGKISEPKRAKLSKLHRRVNIRSLATWAIQIQNARSVNSGVKLHRCTGAKMHQ